MKIGYARVSTDDQDLSLQIDALKKAGCEKIFQDGGISGIVRNRKALGEALSTLQAGDVLVTWRLDRLGRSLAHLIDIIADLGEREIGFQSLCEVVDTTTPGGKLTFHIMGALAEFERSLISERTKAGMASAKARGKKLGRPRKLTDIQLRHARKRIETGGTTIRALAEKLGVSPKTLSKALRRLD
ncbi:recombinase family protein [Sneathiella sp.]|uniref:recombinase family protein n=1 Tax=Sneathiella sp. TaxID=1964365 RepID=UPI0026143E75|nr:recombinase family protein [Sneathiella sp.]MDF2365641.1 recombinase family protein [Sneathiella sp.]